MDPKTYPLINSALASAAGCCVLGGAWFGTPGAITGYLLGLYIGYKAATQPKT